MPAKGQILIGSGTTLVGSAATNAVTWDGGRTICTIDATFFGAGVQLMIQSPNFYGPSPNFIPVCSAFVSAQVFNFDAPPGTYKLTCGSGACTGLFATLTSTTYLG